MENDKIWEIFQIRIEALEELNPKRFVENSYDEKNIVFPHHVGPRNGLINATLAAQKYIETRNPQLDGDIDLLYVENLIDSMVKEPTNIFLIPDLVGAYLGDIRDGIINKKGELIGDIKKSHVMQTIQNKEEYGVPADAHKTIAKYDKGRIAKLKERLKNSNNAITNENAEEQISGKETKTTTSSTKRSLREKYMDFLERKKARR